MSLGELNKILFGILLLILMASFQDAAYKGGNGDGFAEAELIRHTTSTPKITKYEIRVYPNPVLQGADVFVVNTELASFMLIDVNGNTTYLGENISKISTSNLSKGAYILQVKSGEQMGYSKIIVL
jgi:hypothetical protein